MVLPFDNLTDEIASRENIERSFDEVVGHLECAAQRKKYRRKKQEVCDRLQRELNEGSFRIGKGDYKEMDVMDGVKLRRVQVPKVYCRVGCHAVMVIVEKYVYPTLIKNTAASIPGKGMHWLHHIVEQDIKNAPEQTQNYYQCDVFHYYDSIMQWRMKLLIRVYVSDERLLPILDNFIELLPYGLSKGLRSSQCFANLFLSKIDHKMLTVVGTYELELKDGTFEMRYLYYRYCDDIVMFARDKKELWRLRNLLVHEMGMIDLIIKPNEAVRPLKEGLDYLGYVHYPPRRGKETYSRLRKRTKQKAARKLAKVKSRKRRQEIMGALKGMACHGDCKHLYHKLTGEKMKKFGEMGIVYTPKDGKKRFAGDTMRLAAVQNMVIEVHDFERDVKTSQGDGRYLVSFRNKQTGVWGKFFTASEEMKNILDQIADEEEGFPFETTIVSDRYDGNKVKYRFT